uniref:Retrotransposon gag domain-containing protein n=1 Tax=Chromera velia CCMP2878 TaxID=1169474 RepID=A0A0G4HZQ8_9ALVE|eukprot:Cvel_34049.t1-p1 / transcript=Cvel_34049.t1 / gene=Cvel_34049 / organism=Chromera_velia_CCMP2878 / gene_product=Retrovirus-related Pol polyprotein from transposon, putative / transcript_product=Retrovirus-related Pol polyprotein from transposon, putative / location=Cvel_scaffold5720:335-3771(-) / protein_length=354 / sequence_SO=supercontig / SO=protein_coding / is_pseudo=false
MDVDPLADGPVAAAVTNSNLGSDARSARVTLRDLDPGVLMDLQRQGFQFRINKEGDLLPVAVEQAFARAPSPAATQQRFRNIPKVKTDLPTFTGEDQSQTKAYWRRLVRLNDRMGWEFLDFRDIYFPSTLTGKAKTWYDHLPAGRLVNVFDIEELGSLFLKEYKLTEADQDSAEGRLFTLKQKLTKSIDDYASRYRSLCNESRKDIDSTYTFKHFVKGLTNKTSAVERLFKGLIGTTTFLFMDDILSSSPNFTTHLKDLKAVLDRLQRIKAKVSFSKCKFAALEVEYLGHRITPTGILPSKEKTKAIEEATSLKNIRELRGWLGLCNYYKKFCLNYAAIASPLYDLTRKNVKFQ